MCVIGRIATIYMATSSVSGLSACFSLFVDPITLPLWLNSSTEISRTNCGLLLIRSFSKKRAAAYIGFNRILGKNLANATAIRSIHLVCLYIAEAGA